MRSPARPRRPPRTSRHEHDGQHHGINKIYDGTSAATVTLTDNRVAGDVFTDADGSASFADKNVGNGKAVAVAGITVAGTDAGNYSLASTTASTTANITPRTLTVSTTAAGKVYDGTTAATATLTDNRVAGDNFTDADASATFTDKNVGNGKGVTVSGITIAGTDAGNYTLSSTTATTSANLIPRALTVARPASTRSTTAVRSRTSSSPTTASRATASRMPTARPSSPTRMWATSRQ